MTETALTEPAQPGPRPQRARGAGRLETKALDGRSRLATLFQDGCAKIRIPESFDGRMEAVLINSSGGLTGGDRLDWAFTAGPGTHLTLTTQACEKIYRASADTAAVTTRITVGAGAVLHWLPQESILFDQASLSRRLDVDLDEGAQFLAVEAILLGRKAMGEAMVKGLVRDRWRIHRRGRLVHAEDLLLQGAVDAQAREAAVLDGHVAFATLLYLGPRVEARLKDLRALADAGASAAGGLGTMGVSQWTMTGGGFGPGSGASGAGAPAAGGPGAGESKLVARFASPDGFALRKLLIPAISALRGGASVPKVWSL